MVRSELEVSRELVSLYRALVGEVADAGCVATLGTDGPQGPYALICSPPERRSQAARFTSSRRTTVRLQPYGPYLRHLQESFPRLAADLPASCRPGRPFLVVEGWLRYVALGQRLLDFARRWELNLRHVDYARGESRLNDVRITFDRRTQVWKLGSGPVADRLSDPRRERRSWIVALDPRWRLGRTTSWLNEGVRRAAALILS